MRSLTLSTALLLVFAWPAAAEQPAAESAGAAAFNEAWQAYADLEQSADTAARREAARRVVDIGRQILPDDDDRVPALLVHYGIALLRDKDASSAEDVLEEALELAESIHGKNSDEIIFYLEKYADASAHAGDYRRQSALFRRALKITARHTGKDSLEYGDLALRAGVSIMTSGHSLDGKAYLLDAEEIFLAHPEAGPERKALAALWLGKVELAERDDEEATDYLLRALDGFQAADRPMTLHELATHGHLVHIYEKRGMSAAATKHCLAIGASRPDRSNADFMPVFRRSPTYPDDMLRAGRQGFVEFSFTVDENGFVRDPVVIDREGGRSFETAALEAVKGFRYAPKFEEGEPVAVADVKTRVTFKIE